MRVRTVHFPVATMIILVAAVAALVPVIAQDRGSSAPPAVTAADYARAETFLAATVGPLVVGGSVTANWLADDRMTYRRTTADGTEFVLVDPVKRTSGPAFDHVKLAASLSAAAGASYTARQLPFQSVDLASDGKTVSFDVETRRFSCDVQGTACAPAGTAIGGRSGRGAGERGAGRGGAGNAVASPDGKRAAFIRDFNLWIRDVATGQEKAVTTDGVKNFGYATDNAGWASSDRAVLLWSPDSKKIATFQQDEREVGDMYLVQTRAGHPTLQAWKYPLPGDAVVAMLHRVIIDVEAGTIVRFQMPPDFHRATLGDNFSVSDMKWSPDASRLAFVSTSRDHKEAVLRVADAATGAVRTVFDEREKTNRTRSRPRPRRSSRSTSRATSSRA